MAKTYLEVMGVFSYNRLLNTNPLRRRTGGEPLRQMTCCGATSETLQDVVSVDRPKLDRYEFG